MTSTSVLPYASLHISRVEKTQAMYSSVQRLRSSNLILIVSGMVWKTKEVKA